MNRKARRGKGRKGGKGGREGGREGWFSSRKSPSMCPNKFANIGD